MQTSYALLKFPKENVASLLFEGDETNIERLVLVNGDVFSGFLLDRYLNFQLRTGPQKSIRREKLSKLGLKIRPDQPDVPMQSDLLILKNGDLFRGDVKNESLTIVTSYAGELPVLVKDIGLVEFSGKKKVVTKITLRNGDTMQGILVDEDVLVDLAYGPEVSIYQDRVLEIRFVGFDGSGGLAGVEVGAKAISLDGHGLGVGFETREGEVFVADVEAGSPAEKGGLLAGDVVSALNGSGVASLEGVREAIQEVVDGRKGEVSLEIRRGTDLLQFIVTQ